MTPHTGRVLSYDQAAREARVVLGGIACRVCGGRGCALKDRIIRVAVSGEHAPAPGDIVRVAGDARAMRRAVGRLLLLPALAAVVGYAVAGNLGSLGTASAAGAAGAAGGVGAVLVILVLQGSRRGDLPRVVEVVPGDLQSRHTG